jgi:hypothetical protein
MTIVPKIERQLHAAAARRAAGPLQRAALRTRRWRVRLLARPLLVGVAVVLSATGVAVAARALVGVGSPAPREYPRLDQAVLRAGTRVLSLRVPDPGGGPPWGMRLIFTAAAPSSKPAHARVSAHGEGVAHWGCVQVGRIVDGELGVLGQDGAFHDDGLFHELPVQPEACGSVNDAGQLTGMTGGSNIEVASAYQGLDGCVTQAARRQRAIALPSIRVELAIAEAEGDRQRVRAALEGLASYRRIASQLYRRIGGKIYAEPTCPVGDLRHITFGVVGPHARSVTVTTQGRQQTITVRPIDDGAYLIVQRGPGSQQPFSTPRASPLKPAAPTALSRRAERDPSTPNPVTVTPAVGGPFTRFRLAFRALLNGGGYGYAIESDGPRRCQREAEHATGGHGVGIGPVPIVRGQAISMTLMRTRHGLCAGSYRVYVSYSDPGPGSLPSFPFATVRFTVRR